MANYVLTKPKVYLHGYDLSALLRSIGGLVLTPAPVDNTTFGVGTRTHTAGLSGVEFTADGFSDFAADKSDTALTASFAVAGRVITVGPETGAAGEISYAFQALQGTYQPFGGSVGDMAAFVLSAGASGDWVRGTMLENGSFSATTNGTARSLGAASATQKIYAALQILSGTGTVGVRIESDDGAGFASPTTRITFTSASGRAAEWLSLAGPVTDTFWRAVITITAGGPFTIAVMMGIR